MFSCDFFDVVADELDVLGAGAAAAGAAAVELVDFFSVELLSVLLLASDFLPDPYQSFTPPWLAQAPRFDVADV
jgi:hypothetical protein